MHTCKSIICYVTLAVWHVPFLRLLQLHNLCASTINYILYDNNEAKWSKYCKTGLDIRHDLPKPLKKT